MRGQSKIWWFCGAEEATSWCYNSTFSSFRSTRSTSLWVKVSTVGYNTVPGTVCSRSFVRLTGTSTSTVLDEKGNVFDGTYSSLVLGPFKISKWFFRLFQFFVLTKAPNRPPPSLAAIRWTWLVIFPIVSSSSKDNGADNKPAQVRSAKCPSSMLSPLDRLFASASNLALGIDLIFASLTAKTPP